MRTITQDAAAGQLCAELARRGAAAETEQDVVARRSTTPMPCAGPRMVPIVATAGTGLRVTSVTLFDKIATQRKRIAVGKQGDAERARRADHRGVCGSAV